MLHHHYCSHMTMIWVLGNLPTLTINCQVSFNQFCSNLAWEIASCCFACCRVEILSLQIALWKQKGCLLGRNLSQEEISATKLPTSLQATLQEWKGKGIPPVGCRPEGHTPIWVPFLRLFRGVPFCTQKGAELSRHLFHSVMLNNLGDHLMTSTGSARLQLLSEAVTWA